MISNYFWGGAAAPYQIEQSLRFANGGNYLTRTPSSAGSRTTWTYSAWVKYTIKSANHGVLLSAGSAGSNYDNIRITTTGHTPPTALSWYSNNAGYSRTAAKVRDPSAWYHFVFVWDTTNGTAADRRRMYINGVRQTNFYDNSNPGSSTQSYVNNNWLHAIGALTYNVNTTSEAMDGYMAEVHFVDGTAKDPTDFGEYDESGVWRPIAYSGSYGTNGYYLKFDPSASNGVGHDHSGNGNNWTANNFTTSGTGTDVMSDTPTNNFATLNPIYQPHDMSFSDGNLFFQPTTSNWRSAQSTIPVTGSGKYYCEMKLSSINQARICLTSIQDPDLYNYGVPSYTHNGVIVDDDLTQVATGATWSSGDVMALAINMDNGSVAFYKNGSLQGTVTGLDTSLFWRPGVIAYTSSSNGYFNFGQRAWEYTPPTGFDRGICTSNLPAPDIKDGSKYFNTVLYTGNGSTNNITGVGFQPDIVWIKDRDNSAYVHQIFDSVRGTSAALVPSEGTAENNYSSFTSFDSDGFTVPNALGTNTNNTPIVAWTWKEGAVPGLDIVTYTGNGYPASGTQNISHNLGVAPSLIILKDRDTTSNWVVGHQSLGWTKGMEGLDDGDGVYTNSDFWNNTAPTSTVFTVGTNSGTNYQNHGFVAYCFAEVEGYSKFGSYTGNGSTNGPFVYCGFKPELIILKRTVSNTSWHMLDSTRNTYNPADQTIRADANTQEQTDTAYHVDLLSNGFKLRASYVDTNSSGYEFIYLAFASHPFGGSGVSPATAR